MNTQQNENLKSLLSQSLRERQDSYTIQRIFEQFPTTSELLDVTEQQLIEIKGIGMSKARQITAMLKLAKVLTVPNHEQYIIRSPSDVHSLLSSELSHLTKEHFVCLFLNTKNRLLFKEVISIGSLNSAIVHPREVFRAAIKRCSASVICVHNHPSGDSTPSPEDIELTKRLVSAGEIVGIEVLDHIIIGGSSYVSLKGTGIDVIALSLPLESLLEKEYDSNISIFAQSIIICRLVELIAICTAAKTLIFALAANNIKHFDADTDNSTDS